MAANEHQEGTGLLRYFRFCVVEMELSLERRAFIQDSTHTEKMMTGASLSAGWGHFK